MPTRLMSPLSTLKNWGSSSMLQSRMKLPMPRLMVPSGSFFAPMMRGSKSSLNIMPSLTRFCSIRSFFIASAPITMERIFRKLNLRPLHPTRTCLNRIGPGDWM